jgi:transcriptional regulator with XRE-family HTH domain
MRYSWSVEIRVAELRAARIRAGLSQAVVARRVGTTQSAIARLETSGADPRLSTVERYVHALGARLVVEDEVPTIAAVGGRLKPGLPEEALRLAIQFIDDVAALPDALRPRAIRDEPEPTGSARWDAFLAALAEYVAYQHALRVPGWTAAPARTLTRFWFVIEDILGRPANGLAANAFVTSPAQFAGRGIFLDRSTLISL